MPFGAKVTITNSRDLIRALDLLDKQAPAAARRAIGGAMAIAKKAAVALAPVDSGLLKRSIKARAYVKRDKTAVIGEIIVRHNKTTVVRPGFKKPTVADPFYYAHLVELGTKPHSVPRRFTRGRVRSNKPATQPHPGTRARPFIKPAVENNAAAMQAEFERRMEAELQKIWNGA